MSEPKINKGIELMLRRAKPKEQIKPKGFGINKTINFLKRKVYFNFEIRWEKNT
tara:strand:- start:451 stop:612 length:162 start_codon:yes stop_codon:yes gene_type:complete